MFVVRTHMATTHDFPADYVKDYSTAEVTVHWQPHKCIHSAICMRGLPAVFQPWTQPWIKPHGAEADAVIATVKACPSGALTYTDLRK